ncbi:MAG TPA: transglutaminase family protein [Candidatus Competibacter sp.]|nr:transglutaminase family protein [Candidatus Competibacter sp.]
MQTILSAFDQAIRTHDDLLKRRGLAIWIGAEPTFTDRRSEAPEWLYNALGPTKEARARRMLTDLAQTAGGVMLRTLGRQYPKEELPRWNLGLYQRRDGRPVWSGPPDPLANGPLDAAPSPDQLDEFWAQLAQRLGARGWPTLLFSVEASPKLRVVFRRDNLPLLANPARDPRLARPSLHGQPIPPQGPRDDLAEQGTFLLAIDWFDSRTGASEPMVPCIELPACGDVEFFLNLLEVIGEAARIAKLPTLVLAGFPPPVDASIAWTTLTPDPAVVEANMAPAPDIATFLNESRASFAAASVAGLAPYRLHYNGQITDSGGGGQLTLGGPNPDSSPFLSYPHLLPALIGYFNRHPALSFYFAGDFVGNSSQAPRPDERTTDIFEELALALALLKHQRNPTPDLLWQSLSPFLADPAGNTHRTELNIEKLWNPYLPGRGRLGLVEFRAFRMPPTPERLAALAALLRAIAAMLIQTPDHPELVHWGRELHDRFALPYYLRADLWEVLDELASVGLGLGQPLIEELLDESYYRLGEVEFDDCRLIVRRGLEFWPLLGDAASQEHGHSRLVDASTARLEISLRPRHEAAARRTLADWQLAVNGYRLPLRREDELDGETRVFGLRYRRFKPWIGLHPSLEAQGPIELTLSHPSQSEALWITLHEWRPQGGGYDGLPHDLADAAARRAERFAIKRLDTAPTSPSPEPPSAALTPYCLDLRRL